jgi:hypothetical protein
MKAAIYLVGQGTYYRPRLIEVQYYRIVRYLELTDEEFMLGRCAFVDLNPRLGRFEIPSHQDLPQLVTLCDAIRRGEYETVLVDLQESVNIIESAFSEAGARVINVFTEKTVLERAFRKRLGVGANFHSDTTDFVTFFPNYAADIGYELTSGLGPLDHALSHRLDVVLASARPNAGHNYASPLLPLWRESKLFEDERRKKS